MMQDQAPRSTNTNPIVFGVTRSRLGGVWWPKKQRPSEREAVREKEGRTKMEESGGLEGATKF